MKVVISETAARAIAKLPSTIGKRVVKKMQWFAIQENPLLFAKKLTNSQFGTHRFRIGDYRVLVDFQNGEVKILFVLDVRHRKEAYQL